MDISICDLCSLEMKRYNCYIFFMRTINIGLFSPLVVVHTKREVVIRVVIKLSPIDNFESDNHKVVTIDYSIDNCLTTLPGGGVLFPDFCMRVCHLGI